VIQEALLSAVEGAAIAHVLLVDVDVERRASLAALLQLARCRVVEASTPLEAIDHLGGSPIDRWVVAIADSVPATTADELPRPWSRSSGSRNSAMRSRAGTSGGAVMYLVISGPSSACSRSAWLGSVSIAPPAMSAASRAISNGERVTLSLVTLASPRSGMKVP